MRVPVARPSLALGKEPIAGLDEMKTRASLVLRPTNHGLYTMTQENTPQEFDATETLQSGHPDGKVLHLDDEDSDFIIELLNAIIDRLDGIEFVLSQLKEPVAESSGRIKDAEKK
jgi:hypothetical protein